MLFIVRILIRWRKSIILAGLLTAAAMVGVSFLLPKWYTASSTVFPPEPNTMMGAYADMMQSLQLPVLGPNAIGQDPKSIYVDVLKSRRIGQQIIDEFDFRSVYGTGMLSSTLGELHSHAVFSLHENGLLHIQFEDKDPERAAAVVNRWVSLLDSYNTQANITRASKTKKFISGQLESRRRALREAEEELRVFQQENQALEMDEQVGASIEIVSELTAQAIALEVELEILRQYTSTSSQEYVRKKREYDELLDQLKKFKIHSTRDEEDFVRSFFPTFDTLPTVSLEMARRMRAVKIEEKVFELLVKEYEVARIEEARDVSTVQVLDLATPPEMRSRPKRKVLAILGGIAGIGWSSLLALIVTIWREENGRGRAIRDAFEPVSRDFGRVFRKG
jgi:uncharacterized protein involved in exopolysaccharide biosynthesis